MPDARLVTCHLVICRGMPDLSIRTKQLAGDWFPRNRHLTFIDQLFDLAEPEGVDLDPKLKVTKLRAIDSADERERDERLKLPLSKTGSFVGTVLSPKGLTVTRNKDQ